MDFTVLGRIWIAAGLGFIALTMLDFLQRRYEIDREKVAIRRMFLWSSRELPTDVTVRADALGQVLILGARTQRPILKIPRIYNRGGTLVSRLDSIFRGSET
jgi:hypothetical protein